MKGLITVLLLVVLGACSATAFVLSLSVDTAVTTYAEMEQRPDSVADIILESRQTGSAVPPERRNGMFMGAGLLALVLVFVGASLAIMLGGGRFMREMRLLRRKPARAAQATPPLYTPYQHQYPAQDSLPARTIPRTRELPAWTESDESDFDTGPR